MRPDTKAIRARAEAATVGPWDASRNTDEQELIVTCDAALKRHPTIAEVVDDTPSPFENAAFIAAARTDVPALCDRVEELEAALDRIAREAEASGFIQHGAYSLLARGALDGCDSNTIAPGTSNATQTDRDRGSAK